ncbi:hypothetical protein A1507_12300 [Methylomonas koyamae]|uniref:Uncharacterized protein n=1 Tax=Methylomonas koyamae TaxID=702114 RepID=A0A177NE48_9GAMM|nr:hypothetical protein [Methylomonas koyamae]OAI16185.1 hypothetical protein A1507_12300 [Methylomonas koyamae]
MLIDSLSALFAFTSFIRWYEALLVAIGLGLLVFYLTPEPDAEWEEREPPSLYFYLQWSWLGYLKLKDAFYPFFILYNAVLFLIDYRVQEGEFTVASWVTMHIIMAMPLIYWTGAVWRCSDKTGSRRWAVLARLMTVAAFLDLLLRWVIYRYYPNIFFNCQQMTIHWGDC